MHKKTCLNLSLLAALGTFAFASAASGACPGATPRPALALHEWNAVNDSQQLGSNGCDLIYGNDCDGNLRNWIELLVIEDHLDITGWVLEWENADPDSGTVTFSSNAVWTDLRAGTIITVLEYDAAECQPSATFENADICNGDWHIHVRLDQDTYISHNEGFQVDNDNWRMRILDDGLNLVQDWVGESITLGAGSDCGWGECAYSGNIGNDEAGKLQIETVTATTDIRVCDYDDSDHTSFGCSNRWGSGVNRKYEDLSALRLPVWDDICDPKVEEYFDECDDIADCD